MKRATLISGGVFLVLAIAAGNTPEPANGYIGAAGAAAFVVMGVCGYRWFKGR